MGFGPPQSAGVEAVTGASGDLPIPFDFVPVSSFPSHVSDLGKTLPRAHGSPGWLHPIAQEGWVARTIPAVHFPPCLAEKQASIIPFQPL